MKIAVVGSGISGLSAAYYLSKKNHVDLFEKEDHFGGHSHTIDLMIGTKKVPVDIGFIVFNFKTYPNLINFFKENKIEIEKSDMSFSVSVENSNFEYCGKGLNGIFSNKMNFFNIRFLKMFFDIIKFYKKSDKLDILNEEITLGDYLKRNNLSKEFINYHLIPMVSAIWSMPPYAANKMPLKFFLKFFQNHGLFKLKNRPQWYTVSNRSRAYVKKVTDKISGEIFKNYKVDKLIRSEDNIRVIIGNDYVDYDQVVLASHADQSLRMIEKPTEQEKNILEKFNYVKNEAYLHTDERLMPHKKKAWSSWNSVSDGDKTCITYWLNKLQNLDTSKDYFLTLNPIYKINENSVIKKVNFTHPYLNSKNTALQKDLRLIQGKKRTWFCGSYFGNGFHEDGLKSSIELVNNFKM